MIDTEQQTEESGENEQTTYCGNIAETKSKCLWCGNENSFPFCIGGGKLPMGGTAKSLCYQSFIVILKSALRKCIELSPEQKFVATHLEELKTWNQSLPNVKG